MRASEEDRLARAALSRLCEPGDPRVTALVEEIGPVALRDALLAEEDLTGLRSDVAVRLAGIDPVRDLTIAEKLGLRFVVPGDAEWPSGLADLAGVGAIQVRGGVPVGLWVKGPLSLAALGRSVAIVGSRSATSYGTSAAGEIAAVAARSGYVVVSGAAFGIDQAAHRGAIGGPGPTVAIVACSADRVYPRAHRSLIDYIGTVGAVISEAPPASPPTRVRFLARNRLIAAVTTATVVVEASVRSGALNTANWADRLCRVVAGVPGPVTSASSQGVHQLIRRGAVLVSNGAEVLEVLGESGEHLVTPPTAPARPRDKLNVRQHQVLDAVPVHRCAGADSIARAAGIGVLATRTLLTQLEQIGLVIGAAGGWRLSPAARSDA